MIRRLFWDIEVSPNVVLAWSAGFKKTILPDSIIEERKIISVAWKWEGERKVESLTWDRNQNDRSLLKTFVPILESSDEAVAYFGDSFDMPWVRTRCLVSDIPISTEIVTIDPITWARKFFFNSNKLDYISKFLGGEGKIPTSFALWRDILVNKCDKSLAYMVSYNKEDVVELERVYHKLAAAMPAKTHIGVFSGGEKWSCPKCASGRTQVSKTRVTAKGAKQFQMKCSNGHYYTISAASHKVYLEG